MTTSSSAACQATGTELELAVRARRIWYHDIEINDEVRTRFPEDYQANPVLRNVDHANNQVRSWLERHWGHDWGGRAVLDLGCADGGFSFWAAGRGARQVTGIERNRFNHDRASWLQRQLDLEQVEFHCGSLERHCQDLPDNSFDVILCIALLYHLVDPLGTLHRIHRLCRGKLAIITAIDLPEGDGTPLARLDRYATGVHGFWSHNVPMVRQMLSTVGFDIESEHVERRDAGDRYAAVAVPSAASDHHVFDDTVDQPFPINIGARRDVVRRRWRELVQSNAASVAVFGAGTHTPWLLDAVHDIEGVTVPCVLDDRIMPSAQVANRPVRKPTDIDPSSLDAVVISSWHQSRVLVDRAREVFGPAMKLITFD